MRYCSAHCRPRTVPQMKPGHLKLCQRFCSVHCCQMSDRFGKCSFCSFHVAVFWRIDKVHLCNLQCQSLHSSNLSSSLCRNVQHFTVCIFMCVFTMCILQKCSFYSVYVTEFCVFYCVLVWFPHLPLSNSSFNPGSQNLGNTAALHHDEDSSDIQ